MNIEDENKAAEYYIGSEINGIHTPRTNKVELNYLDLKRLMHKYAEHYFKINSYLGCVMRCICCDNTTDFSEGGKQQILIENEYRYIYATTCNDCGKVCEVDLFD